MHTVHEIPTPAAVVDLDRLEANLRRMQRYADAHGIQLRPHTKTHKAPWIAQEQVRLGARGITVATPIEARELSPVAPETLVAFPPVGSRARALAEVMADLGGAETRFLVGLDSVRAVDELTGALRTTGVSRPVGVLVEVDLGMGRCGVAGPDEAAEVARACRGGVEYRGVMFYPGHIRQRVAEQDAQLQGLARNVDELVTALGEDGLTPEIVSGGSTPTASRSHEIPHQTEIRAGTYVFNDRITAAMGACAWEDCAYTIVATVVSTAVQGQAVVDAGTKALSGDGIATPGFSGYGQLLEHPDVEVVRKSEEHGILDLSHTDWRPEPGERVRIIPNHVCVSVNLQRWVFGVRGEEIERVWEVGAKNWYSET